jgi:hypothetical protein
MRIALIDHPDVTTPFSPINYQVIKLDGLTQLLNSALVDRWEMKFLKDIIKKII